LKKRADGTECARKEGAILLRAKEAKITGPVSTGGGPMRAQETGTRSSHSAEMAISRRGRGAIIGIYTGREEERCHDYPVHKKKIAWKCEFKAAKLGELSGKKPGGGRGGIWTSRQKTCVVREGSIYILANRKKPAGAGEEGGEERSS